MGQKCISINFLTAGRDPFSRGSLRQGQAFEAILGLILGECPRDVFPFFLRRVLVGGKHDHDTLSSFSWHPSRVFYHIYVYICKFEATKDRIFFYVISMQWKL